MRILFIDSDEHLVTNTEAVLINNHGIICDHAYSGEEGIEMVKNYDYELVLLDMNLPDITGYQVLMRLRASNIKTPVIALSSIYTDSANKVKALNLGADDFITKDFDEEELVARIKAVIRRFRGHSKPLIKIDRLAIDLNSRSVLIDDNKIHLTNKEYAVLELMATRKDAVITKDMFLDHLYEGEEPQSKIVDVFICKLRKKLANLSGGTKYIDTIWGTGYKLKTEDAYNNFTQEAQAIM